MEAKLQSLRADFLRLLEQIEEVIKETNDSDTSHTYDPSKYESCIKVNGRPILPPVMSEEKRQACQEWREEAVKVEEKLALQRRRKHLEAVKAIIHEEISIPEKLDPIKNDESSQATEVTEPRTRRLSYTLDEPSPVLLAYMQRFGQSNEEENDQKSQLEEYLSELSKAPDIKVNEKPDNLDPNEPNLDNESQATSITLNLEDEDVTLAGQDEAVADNLNPEVADSLDTIEDTKLGQINDLALKQGKATEDVQQPTTADVSPGKENVPPLSNNPEWTLNDSIPLAFNEGPTWAKSPNKKKEQSPQQFDMRGPPSLDSGSAVLSVQPTPRSEAITIDTSLLESVTLTLPPSQSTMSQPTVEFKDPKAEIEAAVSALALQQQREIQRLMDQQAKEREQLKQLFEEQQRQLIESVLSAVSTKTSPIQSTTLTSSTILTSTRPVSPLIPTVKPKVDPSTLTLPQNWSLPEDAKTPVNNVRFEKLSALIKGHLTRRLMKTAKVESIIVSMKDIMSMALQLHREGHQFPKLEDVQLHARLLQQLQKESNAFHDIFFKYTTQQKMGIIRLDRELKAERETRASSSADSKKEKRRISAVTEAKILQKQQIQAMLNNNNSSSKSPRRKLASSSPRVKGSRRSLNFGERASSVASSVISSPRSAGKYSIASNRGRVHKSGVKSLNHSKPWK